MNARAIPLPAPGCVPKIEAGDDLASVILTAPDLPAIMIAPIIEATRDDARVIG